jgi:hypothetical protein
MNVWDVIEPIERLIRSRVNVDDRLADPQVPLEQNAALSPDIQRSAGEDHPLLGSRWRCRPRECRPGRCS